MGLIQPGTWSNIFSTPKLGAGNQSLFNLPGIDLGITERLGIGTPNPKVVQGGALFYTPPTQTQTQAAPTDGTGYMTPAPNMTYATDGNNNQTKKTTNTGGGSVLGMSTSGITQQPVPSTGLDQDWLNTLNEYYTPAFNRLAAQRASYVEQQPIAEKEVENMYNQGLIPIENTLTEGQQNIANQRLETAQGQESMMTKVRRAYNELMQAGANRFGGGSSAGDAYSALTGRQAAENMGSVMQTAQKAFSSLDTDLNKLVKWSGDQKTALAEKKQTAIDKIRQDFRDKIAAIDGQAGELEQNKAAQKIQALKEARDRAYAVEDANVAAQRQIDLYNAQQQSILANKYAVNGNISTEALNAFKTLSPLVGVPAAAQMSGVDLSQVQGVIQSPSQQWKDLGNGMLINTATGQVITAPDTGTAGLSALINPNA